MKEHQGYIKIEDLNNANSLTTLIKFLKNKNGKAEKLANALLYQKTLRDLQVELIKLQKWIWNEKKRVAIIFEGRDTSGKGGVIHRFTEHLNPRSMRIVALPIPTEDERGQWYFQRYIKQLPNPGEIVFFNRSWYNRTMVEPVNSFCTQEEYHTCLNQIPEFENMLEESGVIIIKFWFSIKKKEQAKRLDSWKSDPLKKWKISELDLKAQDLWDDYTHYKDKMLHLTHNEGCPWIIIDANRKKPARLEAIKYVLRKFPYSNDEKLKDLLEPDPNILLPFNIKI